MFMTKKDTSITSGHLFQQIQKCTLYCIHQIKVNPLVPASLSLLVLACGVVPSDGEEVGKHLLEGGVRGEDGGEDSPVLVLGHGVGDGQEVPEMLLHLLLGLLDLAARGHSHPRDLPPIHLGGECECESGHQG